MEFLRSALLLSYLIFISNVILNQSANKYENLTEESTCYNLQESDRYPLIEEYSDFLEELQDKEMSVPELPLQGTLRTDAKCYIESRNSESLKKVLTFTCTPDEEKQI